MSDFCGFYWCFVVWGVGCEIEFEIFVSHFLKNGHHQSHYFDNDNLAIKSILDAIVPLV